MFWKLFALFAALMVWIGLLWLALPFDFLQLSLPTIIALHLLPPVGACCAGYAGIAWFTRWRKTNAHTAMEAAQRAEREKRKAEYKNQFEQTLSQRRAALHCRWIKAAEIIRHETFAPLPAGFDAVTAKHAQIDAAWPMPTLAATLDELFSQLPVAAGFPVSVVAAPHASTDILMAQIAQARAQVLARENIKTPPDSDARIHFEPLSDDNLFHTLSKQFSAHPEWPGLLVIAFDSMWNSAPENDPWQMYSSAADMGQTAKWLGKAGRAFACIVVTPGTLDDVLATMNELPDNAPLDDMAPHWIRQKMPAAMSNYLSLFPKTWRETLATSPALALWHRQEAVTPAGGEPIANRIAQLAGAIKSAAENAGLCTPLCEFEGEIIPPQQQPLFKPHECGWLVHNAGGLDVCGDRLAMLASAMMQFGIELNPVKQATNTVAAFGHCGAATATLRLALALGYSAENVSPTLLAEFDADEIRVGFLMPTRRRERTE